MYLFSVNSIPSGDENATARKAAEARYTWAIRSRSARMITDEMDRAYWVRLKPWQHRLLCRGAG